MQVRYVEGDLVEQEADVLVVGHLENGGRQLGGALNALDAALDGEIRAALDAKEMEGKVGEVLHIRTRGRLAAPHVVVAGLGLRKELTPECVRQAAGFAARTAKELKATSIASVLMGAGRGNLETRDSAIAVAEGFQLALYEFLTWKKEPETPEPKVESLEIVEIEGRKRRAAEAGLQIAQMRVKGVRQARDLVNEAPMHLVPASLKKLAEEIAATTPGVSVSVLNRAQCRKLGMNAFLAVAEGADSEPYFIHLTYKPTGGAKKKIALVGKGVTFDSGGLSLKPGAGMITMKMDMAGAATVLGVFRTIGELQPSVEVHGVIAACENMPSGSAYRPGDVIRAMNGVSMEILNTDAEGRVTLADALSYTCSEIKPDAILDFATLTGACVVGLGEEIVGVMTRSDKLAEQVFSAAEETGEELWELPLFKGYDKLLKSQIADIKNVGPKWGGALTAGLFLEHFVEKGTPWIHLDIAGPAFAERDYLSYVPYGGTGTMVRTVMEFLGKQR